MMSFIGLLLILGACKGEQVYQNSETTQALSSIKSTILDVTEVAKQEIRNSQASKLTVIENLETTNEVMHLVERLIWDFNPEDDLRYRGIKEIESKPYFVVEYCASNANQAEYRSSYYIDVEDRTNVYLKTSDHGVIKPIRRLGLYFDLNDSQQTYKLTKEQLDKIVDGGDYKTLWSPSKQYLLLFDPNSGCVDPRCCIWEANEEILTVPKELYGSDAVWSSDSQYFIVDGGTYVIRAGFVYSMAKHKITETIGYINPILWLDSENIVYAIESPNIHIDEIDPSTTDIILHNLRTGISETLLQGTTSYLYHLKTIENENVIVCNKTNIAYDENHELTFTSECVKKQLSK